MHGVSPKNVMHFKWKSENTKINGKEKQHQKNLYTKGNKTVQVEMQQKK